MFNITARNDKYLRKAADVIKYLKDRCREENLYFINHGNTITVESKLHLNKRGT